MALKIQLKTLSHAQDLPLPYYATPGSVGMDLSAAIVEDQSLEPLQRLLIPAGFSIALPAGYEAQIRPRSGLAFKNGITVLNSPGTIDSDYRGEIKVLLVNLSQTPFLITRGLRIAQMVIAPITQIAWQQVEDFNMDAQMSVRGAEGFGSTGK